MRNWLILALLCISSSLLGQIYTYTQTPVGQYQYMTPEGQPSWQLLNPINQQGPIDPSTVSGMQLWLDAQSTLYTNTSYTTVCTTTGQNVGVWQDQSGNGRTLTASGTSPTYISNGLNGHPCVTFNGGYFETTSIVDTSYNHGFTIFTVAQAAYNANNQIIWSCAPLYLSYQSNNMTGGYVFTNQTYNPNLNGDWRFNDTTWESDIEYYPGVYGSSDNLIDSVVMVNWNNFFNCTIGTFNNSSSSLDYKITSHHFIITKSETDPIYIGKYSGGGYSWGGRLGELIIYKGILPTATVDGIRQYLYNKWGLYKRTMVVCVGNSITSGTNSTGGATQTCRPVGNNYPSYLWANLDTTKYDVRCDAYPGRLQSSIINETPYFGCKMYSYNRKNIAVVFEQTNSLASSQNAMFTYLEYVMMCKMYKAAGFKVVAVTSIARGGGLYAGYALDYLVMNALIRANFPQWADGLCDLASHSIWQNPSNATYYSSSDYTHPTSVGYDSMGVSVALAVKKL